MFLYLVQHGKAKPEEENPLRPLSEEGYNDIMKTALFISKLNHDIEYILHSGKLRAKQTAEILAKKLKITDVIETNGLAPLDEPELITEQISNSDKSFMIVGHLPHLSKLASLLLCGDKNKKIILFQMGGAVCLEKNEEIWSVRWIITPEIISDL
jgi:phosphohistidine phosphatase